MMGIGFLWILFIAFAIAYVIGWRPDFLNSNKPNPPEQSAPDILKERYARGEITRDEYLATRKDLELRN